MHNVIRGGGSSICDNEYLVFDQTPFCYRLYFHFGKLFMREVRKNPEKWPSLALLFVLFYCSLALPDLFSLCHWVGRKKGLVRQWRAYTFKYDSQLLAQYSLCY